MKKMRKFALAGMLVVFLLLALAFPFGPFFPWSPVKLGYDSISYARGDVFVSAAAPAAPDYGMLEQMMTEAESFHQLRYQRRVKVIACKDWSTCERGLPWMNTRGLGGVTLYGDVIYITPKLKERHFSIAEFLRHELSHALIGQNTTMLNTFRLNEQPWFYEGMAVSFGRQHDYLKRDEFLDKLKTEPLLPYLDPGKRANPWNARFAYPAQRYFIEWLRMTYGEPRFHQFLQQNLAAPREWRALFAATFSASFEEAAQRYEQALRASAWVPAE